MRLDKGKMEELRDRILELNGKRLSELDEVQLKLYGTALSYNRKLELLIISKQINENDSIIYIGKFDGLCAFGQEEGKS
jgi:hypothetical protein